MTLHEENPVSTGEAAKILKVSWSTISAIKRAMGITRHKVFMSEIRKFLRNNKNFTTTPYYPRKAKEPQPGQPKPPTTHLAKGEDSAASVVEALSVSESEIKTGPAVESSPVVAAAEPPSPTADRFRSALGSKLRYLRGKRSADDVAKCCNPKLTRESIFRIERGDPVKRCTVKNIAMALGVSKADMSELIKEWVVQMCGEDAQLLKIEPAEPAMVDYSSQVETQFSEIKPLLQQLSAKDRDVLIRSLGHRELIKRVLQLVCVVTPMIGAEKSAVS